MIAPASAPLTPAQGGPRREQHPSALAADNPPRFTIDGSVALENHLTRTCAGIAAGVRGLVPAGKLEALLLGGGYGRGEGGVWHRPEGDRPYNDLEFYVFLRGNRQLNERRYAEALHVLGEILTPQAGVEVEFKIGSLRELTAADVTMFSYDLVAGHRRLIGDQRVLAGCERHFDATAIPMVEATRLLMNRCTGLLLALERLERPNFAAADADFVGRNIAKAQLGAGDAVLAALTQYHWSVRERHERIVTLAETSKTPRWLAAARVHHAAGLDFKLHPERSRATPEELRTRHATVTAFCHEVWLWLESRRLGYTFQSAAEYAIHPGPKLAPRAEPRNFLINFKVFGRAGLADEPLRHPRTRILNVLPLLLWDRDRLRSPEPLAFVRRELRTTANSFADLVAVYRSRWSQVN